MYSGTVTERMVNFKLALSAIISPGFIRRRLVGLSLHGVISEFKTNKRRARSEPVRNLLRSKHFLHFSHTWLFSTPRLRHERRLRWRTSEVYVLRERLALEPGMTATTLNIRPKMFNHSLEKWNVAPWSVNAENLKIKMGVTRIIFIPIL